MDLQRMGARQGQISYFCRFLPSYVVLSALSRLDNTKTLSLLFTTTLKSLH